MYASLLQLKALRSFAELQTIELSRRLNIIIGNNNVGKTTLTYAIRNLQQTCLTQLDISLNEQTAEISVALEDVDIRFFNINVSGNSAVVETKLIRGDGAAHNQVRSAGGAGGSINGLVLKNEEPNNWIFPYLSNRRTEQYNEDIRLANVQSVTGTHHNLAAKLDRLSPREYHAHELFRKVCSDVLGFIPSTQPSLNSGKVPSALVRGRRYIPIASMGSGVPQVASLVGALCEGEGNLFLIEELENDLHPSALKKLLKFIIEVSEKNQVILTTHSNIVLNLLGSVEGTNIIYVEKTSPDVEKNSTAKVLKPDPSNRIQILDKIGYELLDANLYEGWIFFEESSAERIVREFVIPWFAPSLHGKVRTFATNSISAVRKKLEWFLTLVTFMHLQQPVYQNRTWVLVDNGEDGERVIGELKESFCGPGKKWTEDHFVAFSKNDFEHYFPSIFKNRVHEALKLEGEPKREAKKLLLEDVIKWLAEDPARGKHALEESAGEVIKLVQSIEVALAD